MKVQEGLFKILDHLEVAEPKTKLMVGLLRDLGVERRALILLAEENIRVRLAARNLPNVKVLPIEGLNIYDLLRHDYILCSRDAIEKLQERLAS
jgi:large subunit ribosomal protein L4